MSKTVKLHNEDKLVKKAVEVGLKMAKMQGFDLPTSPQPTKIKAVYLFLVGVNQIPPSLKTRWMAQILRNDSRYGFIRHCLTTIH